MLWHSTLAVLLLGQCIEIRSAPVGDRKIAPLSDFNRQIEVARVVLKLDITNTDAPTRAEGSPMQRTQQTHADRPVSINSVVRDKLRSLNNNERQKMLDVTNEMALATKLGKSFSPSAEPFVSEQHVSQMIQTAPDADDGPPHTGGSFRDSIIAARANLKPHAFTIDNDNRGYEPDFDDDDDVPDDLADQPHA